MEIFEIWAFVEQKLQIKVPPYFKYVLKYCGYENGISIATIEDADIEYFAAEVRNGNVSNYFKSFTGDDVLEGSNKTIENFAFSLDHIKQLMYIVSFLKTHIEENGRDSFSMEITSESSSGFKKRKHETLFAPQKRMKHQSSLDSSTQNPEILLNVDVKILEGILISQCIMSLTTHASEIYVKYFRIINSKITATNSIRVEIDESSNESVGSIRYAARICCPFCSRIISLFHTLEQLPNWHSHEQRWNTSAFDAHLKIHQNNLNESDKNFGNIDVIENTNVELSSQKPTLGEINVLETEENTTVISGLLQNFVDSAKRNSSRKKPGYRHDSTTKMFAAFIKMIAGLLAYETLHANFPLSLPSVSTVNRFISDNGPQIIEGEMRTDDLLLYLQSRNFPLRVSLSEDATRITPKISYEPNTNQLIGFAMPLDANGMPIKLSFPARNIAEIQRHFTNPCNFMSSTAYVQMAQPVEENSSPFCLMIFLTDSLFTAKSILKRWKFQAESLREKGIVVDNISSDGDPRPLLAMKCLSRIGIQDLSFLDCEWFSCGGHVETTFTQDSTHIITKLRNRLLKYSRIYSIGNKIISCSHLKYLIKQVSKDKHLLNCSDIEPKDRQNFLSAEKLCSDKTIQCLLDFVPGSEGTALYLKAMNCVLTAYLNIKIKSKDRIYLIWYSVFFFRAWRSWLLNSEKLKTLTKTRAKSYYNLKDNFISSNCYTCIELNAHALVKKVLTEDYGERDSKFFIPDLYGSQPCESMFRQVRSFTSTFSTCVNCSMLDIIHRVRKIQLQNDIITNSNGELKFPRFEKKATITANRLINQDSTTFESLSRAVIISEIERARKSVISDMQKLGIDTSKLNFHCQIKAVLEEDIVRTDSDLDSEFDSDSEEMELRNEFFEGENIQHEEEPDEEMQEDIRLLSGITGELELRDYLENYPEDHTGDKIILDEKSPFVVVVGNKGKEMVVRKSSICWLLSKDKFKLSSDRLQRVQEKEYTSNSAETNIFLSADDYTIKKEITIGEWCIFSKNVDEENPKVLIGLVLGFSYLNGRTFKDKEFSKSSAPVESDRPIGVLYTSYTFNSVGELASVLGDKHKYTKIESYIGTIKNPTYINKTLTISQKLIVKLNELTD